MSEYPSILPRLRYDDVVGSAAWLERVFGFKERLRWADGSGAVRHVELRLNDIAVELSATHDEYQAPNHLGGRSQSLIVWIDDVESHFEHARSNGAAIISEPADMPWGTRQYTVDDIEGHRWEFAQQTREVAPQAWGAQLME